MSNARLITWFVGVSMVVTCFAETLRFKPPQFSSEEQHSTFMPDHFKCPGCRGVCYQVCFDFLNSYTHACKHKHTRIHTQIHTQIILNQY